MSNATESALRARSRTATPGTTFGGIDKSAVRPSREKPDSQTIQASPEFQELRRRLNWFVFPMTAFFLVWYIGYVILAAYFHDFMAQPVLGEVNVGLLLGLAQFVTTVGITMLYARFARKQIDPRVDHIRHETGGEQPQ